MSDPDRQFTYSDALARHYDQDYAVLRHDARDVAFYRALAQASPGPVLEAGCGTGRVLLPVARAGVSITGVDPSPAMLARLAARLADEPAAVRQRVTLVSGSFEQLNVAGPFGLVICPFRGLQHVHGRPARLAALRSLAAVLTPEGRLAFDVFDFDPALAARHVDDHQDYLLEDGPVRRERRSHVIVDAERRQLIGRLRWLADGQLEDEAEFRLSIYDRLELDELLPAAGLEILELWADFDGNPWRAGQPRELVVLARRAP